jgi:glycosyltransferase involved in cell wall biosynthesis
VSETAARPRVFVLGFVESIHTVRAVEAMQRLGWEIHVVASHPHWPHPAWHDVTLHVDPDFEPEEVGPGVEVRTLRRPPEDGEPLVEGLSWNQRPEAVAGLIAELQPDLVNTMEIQHGAYVMLEARAYLDEAPPWVVHNWGSDIYYFGRNPRHISRLKAVMTACDYYGAECHRDIGLAQAFGFDGKLLPVLPNAGGFELGRLAALRLPGPTSTRKAISLKATESFVYRPHAALDAIERCGELLRGYTLYLYTATPRAIERARAIGERFGIEVTVVSTAAEPVSHDEIMTMHGRSRISISLAQSDAICTAFLEAMVMGSFPIQSSTGCANAWAEAGQGAEFVPAEDVDRIEGALRRALTDDQLVDTAAIENAATAAARLDRQVVLGHAIEGYERIAADISGERPWEEFGPEVADPVWAAERQAEIDRAAESGWPRGEVGPEERIEDWYDNELIQRDAHISSLRDLVAAMGHSLDGFHRMLETPPPSVRSRLVPGRARAWVRARAPHLADRLAGRRKDSQ